MRPAGFNPKARWDRHMPQTGNISPHDSLDEKIEVVVSFRGGRIYPRQFTWKNKQYEIKEINYNWQERHGAQTINYFSVDTGGDLYQISFNNTSYGWRLDKVI